MQHSKSARSVAYQGKSLTPEARARLQALKEAEDAKSTLGAKYMAKHGKVIHSRRKRLVKVPNTRCNEVGRAADNGAVFDSKAFSILPASRSHVFNAHHILSIIVIHCCISAPQRRQDLFSWRYRYVLR